MRTIHARDARIPALGFGTFRLEGAVARDQVARALDAGYRHVDTARVYGNEREVGQGIARSTVPRNQVFLTSKLWPDDFRPEDVARATRASLAELGTDHVDLMLLHWPNPEVPVADTLGALERARGEGLIRHYGVSNFTVPLFEEAADAAPRALVTNQVEFHPLLDQRRVRAAARAHGAAVTAYSPLAQGRVAEEPVLREIAEAHGATPAQVSLAWILAGPELVAIPRSSKPERVEENLAAAELALAPSELGALDALRDRRERVIDPEFAPAWDPPGAPA